MRLKSTRVLTEPLGLCECGCGLLIDPRKDASPFFKHPNCQYVWMASQFRPAHLQAAWRRRQRRWFYLVNQGVNWDSAVDWFRIDANYVICYVQGLLLSYMPSRDWRRPTLFDAERIMGEYVNYLPGGDHRWRLPDWVVRRYVEPDSRYGSF